MGVYCSSCGTKVNLFYPCDFGVAAKHLGGVINNDQSLNNALTNFGATMRRLNMLVKNVYKFSLEFWLCK